MKKNNRKILSQKLLEWHGGSSSYIYQLGSSWLVDKNVDQHTIDGAIGEINSIIHYFCNSGVSDENSRKYIKELYSILDRIATFRWTQTKGERRTPRYWSEKENVKIIDPNGWRFDKRNFSYPITFEEYTYRKLRSTIGF